MKKSKFTQGLDYEWVVDTANNARGEDEFGYRSEFVKLVRSADALKSTTILSLNEENFEAEAYSLQPLAN